MTKLLIKLFHIWINSNNWEKILQSDKTEREDNTEEGIQQTVSSNMAELLCPSEKHAGADILSSTPDSSLYLGSVLSSNCLQWNFDLRPLMLWENKEYFYYKNIWQFFKDNFSWMLSIIT